MKLMAVRGTVPRPYDGGFMGRVVDTINLSLTDLEGHDDPQTLIRDRVTEREARDIVDLLNKGGNDVVATREAIDRLEGLFLKPGDDIRFGPIPQSEGDDRACYGACAFQRDILATAEFISPLAHAVTSSLDAA